MQAALDPAIRSIEYLPNIPNAPSTTTADAIALERNDGRYYLDVVEARLRRPIAHRLLIAQSLLDLGLRPLVRTESDIMREPRYTNARIVFEHVGRSVELGLRLQILGALTDDGAMTLGDLLKRLRSDRDPTTAVLALACSDLVELDLISGVLGPRTMTRLRE